MENNDDELFVFDENNPNENDLSNEMLSLCFIKFIGKENDGLNRYEFIFTNNQDEVWGENFDEKPSCLINDLMVEDKYITEIHIVRTKLKFDLIQDSCCFSMSDCYDGITSMAWENIDEYDEYPDDGRVYFTAFEELHDVESKLAAKGVLMN